MLFNIVGVILQALLVALLYWLILFQTNLRFTLIVIGLASLTIFTNYKISVIMRRAIEKSTNAVGDMGAFMQETFSSMAVVKAYGAEAYEQERFSNALSKNLRYSVLLGVLERINQPLDDIVYSVALVVVVIYRLVLILLSNMEPQNVVLYLLVLT